MSESITPNPFESIKVPKPRGTYSESAGMKWKPTIDYLIEQKEKANGEHKIIGLRVSADFNLRSRQIAIRDALRWLVDNVDTHGKYRDLSTHMLIHMDRKKHKLYFNIGGAKPQIRVGSLSQGTGCEFETHEHLYGPVDSGDAKAWLLKVVENYPSHKGSTLRKDNLQLGLEDQVWANTLLARLRATLPDMGMMDFLVESDMIVVMFK